MGAVVEWGVSDWWLPEAGFLSDCHVLRRDLRFCGMMPTLDGEGCGVGEWGLKRRIAHYSHKSLRNVR